MPAAFYSEILNLRRYANLIRLKVMHLEHNQIDRLPGYDCVLCFVDIAAFDNTFVTFVWQN